MDSHPTQNHDVTPADILPSLLPFPPNGSSSSSMTSLSSATSSSSSHSSQSSWDSDESPDYGVCPETSLSADPTTVFSSPHVNHLVIVVGTRIIAQQFQPGMWSVPCVRYSKGRHPSDVAASPEIILFGRHYLSTNHLQLLSERHGPFRKTVISYVDIARAADTARILEHVKQREGILQLMSADELQKADFLSFPDGSNLQSAALLAARMSSETPTAPIPPWVRPGWPAHARNWIVDKLQSEIDIAEEDIAVCVTRTWELGCTAFIPSPDGTRSSGGWWFKACPTRRISADYPATEYDKSLKYWFSEEAMLMKYVSEEFDGISPRVVAIDRDQGYILMADGGSPFAHGVPEEVADAFVLRYLEMQKASAARIETLLHVGCPDRRLRRMAVLLRKMLAESKVAGLPDFEPYYAKLAKVVDSVEAYSGRYAAVLVHSDTHSGNLLYDASTGAATVIDWSDGCVAHPLIDFARLMRRKSASLVDQYLSAFGFPQGALKDAKLLVEIHDTVSLCGMADSAEEGSDTMDDYGHHVRKSLWRAISLLASDGEDQQSSS